MHSVSHLLLLALSHVLQLVSCIPQGALLSPDLCSLGKAYGLMTVALESVPQPGEFLQPATALPDSAGPTPTAAACRACYIVADVAGLVWYSAVFINTAATALISVGVGNGTRATRTSILQNEGAFTFNPGATAGSGALTQLNFAPTALVGGAQLTSPTAYNVFTAYSITSASMSNGVCVTTSGPPIQLTSAYSEALPSANGRVTLDANGQQHFIDFLGFTTCSGGGASIIPTALIQIKNTTATQTSTFSNVPLAAMTASLTIAPQSTPSSSAEPGAVTGGPSTTVFPSVGAPQIILGNMTITPTAHPIALSVFNGTFVGTATNLGGGSSGIVLPYATGTGAGGSASSPYTFLGTASLNGADAWLSVWAAAMVAMGALVFYL